MRTLQLFLLFLAIGVVRSVDVGPSSSPTIEPTSTPSSQPTSQPFGRPSSLPSPQPSSQPSTQPVGGPTGQPSVQPSTQPSRQPTTKPSTRPSNQPTCQPSIDPTSQPSGQPTQQPVLQPTSRPSEQPTSQPSKHPSAQPTSSPTSQPFGYPSGKPSAQPVAEPSSQPTVQPSSTPSRDPSSPPTSQPSYQPSSQPSSQPISQPTDSPTSQPSRQPSVVPTSQPSTSPTGQPSGHPSCQPSHQPSSNPTDQPTTQPSSVPSQCPSAQPSSQPSRQPTTQPSSQPMSRPTGFPSSQPSRQPSVVPTSQPSASPTAQPSIQPSLQPSRQPSSSPTDQPTSQPSRQPSATPSSAPSVIPSSQPSQQPTMQPSARPSSQPSVCPSNCPSGQPTASPSHQSTSQPTSEPTGQPSLSPTRQPSARPSSLPTAQPTWQPSSQPTRQPSAEPSGQPTSKPSVQPTSQPTIQPSAQPTAIPSSQPTSAPSSTPSGQPSARPSQCPSSQPSSSPSAQPTNPTSQPTSQPTSKPTDRPDCPAGTRYVNSPSGFYCVPCDPGFTSEPRSATCTACNPGQYAPTNGSSSCFDCPLGSYQPDAEASICLQCPAGFVTGAVGSTTRAACVSPIINFANGGVALAAFLLFGWIYLGHGRLLRVALHRFFNMVKLSIILAGSVAYMMDLTMLAGAVMTRIERQQPRQRFAHLVWLLKSVVFLLLSVLIMAACVAGTVIYYFFHSVFNALVIWRGYERLIPRIRVNFSGYIEELVERLHLYIPWAVPWGYLLFPVQFIVTAIASIHIDLSAVKVTCRGAQVAGYLFINFLVTNFIVLIIASDWQVYWTTAWQRLLGRNVFLLSNRHYLRYAGGTAVYHAMSALVLGLLPEPKKWIQYALGFVSLQIFFADDGHSPSDANCDATMPFPIDTALAYGATVAAGLMFFPTIFVIAQVLVPSFTFTRPYHPLAGQVPASAQSFTQEREFNSLEWTQRALGISHGEDTAAASSSPTTQRANRTSKRFHHHPLSRRRHERLQEIVRTPTSTTGGGVDGGDRGGSSPSTPRTLQSSSTRSSNRRQFTFSSDSVRLDMQARDASARAHRSSSGSDRDSGKVDSDSDEEAKADATDAAGDPNAQVVYCCRGERKWVSYILSVGSSLLAFDWFSMRWLGQFGVGWFKLNRRFHETYVQHFADDATATATATTAAALAVTSLSADEVEHLKLIVEEAQRIRLPTIPLLLLPMVSKKDSLPAQLWRPLPQRAEGEAAVEDTARNQAMMEMMLREETDAVEGSRSTRGCLSCGSGGSSTETSRCSPRRWCTCCGCCGCCCGGGSDEMERLYDRSVVNRCKVEGRIAWLFHQEEFCSYKDVLELVRRDVVDGFPMWCDTRDTAFAIPLLSAGMVQLLWPCHLLLSPHGRGIWWRVLKNYVYLGMVSLGIWTDASVEDFRVFARYDDFKRSLAFMSKQTLSSSSESQRMRYMANPLASSTARASDGDTSPAGAAASSPASSSSSSSSSSPLAELFTAYGIPFLDDASEDPQELLQYVASNIASRVVLLQLVPYLTAVSVVMADIATCPMFLFSSKLRSRLPPYILWAPFAEARRLLRQSMQWKAVDAQRRRSMRVVDLEAGSRSAAGGATATTHTVEKEPPVWMVWFLGQKLFVTQSLLVRFVVSLTVNFLSLALVFLPTIILDFALLVMVAVMVLMGISVGLYAILLLHRFMFPNAFDDDVQTDPSTSSTAVPAAPAVDPPVVPPPVDGPEAAGPVGGMPSETAHPTAENGPSNDAATPSTTSDRSVITAADVAPAGTVVRRSAESASSNPLALDRPRPASSTEVTVIRVVARIAVVTSTEAVLGDSSTGTASSRRRVGGNITSSDRSGGVVAGIDESRPPVDSDQLVRQLLSNTASASSRQHESSISDPNSNIRVGFTSSLKKMSTASSSRASPAAPTASATSTASTASRASSTPTTPTTSSTSTASTTTTVAKKAPPRELPISL